MRCQEFDRWLDRDRPEAGAAAASAHARSCPRCAAALEAEAALAGLHETPGRPAPAGFTDAVMRRVAREPRRVGGPARRPEALPWWTVLPAQPATALALALAAALAWKGPELWHAATSLGTALAGRVGALPEITFSPAAGALGVYARPEATLALALGLLPAFAWLARVLYLGSARWAGRLAGARPAPPRGSARLTAH